MEQTDGMFTEKVEGGNLTAILQVDPGFGKPEWEITLEMPGSNPEVWPYSGYIGPDFYQELNVFFEQYVASESLRGKILAALQKMKEKLEKAA